jgi:hypothetical protein
MGFFELVFGFAILVVLVPMIFEIQTGVLHRGKFLSV